MHIALVGDLSKMTKLVGIISKAWDNAIVQIYPTMTAFQEQSMLRATSVDRVLIFDSSDNESNKLRQEIYNFKEFLSSDTCYSCTLTIILCKKAVVADMYYEMFFDDFSIIMVENGSFKAHDIKNYSGLGIKDLRELYKDIIVGGNISTITSQTPQNGGTDKQGQKSNFSLFGGQRSKGQQSNGVQQNNTNQTFPKNDDAFQPVGASGLGGFTETLKNEDSAFFENFDSNSSMFSGFEEFDNGTNFESTENTDTGFNDSGFTPMVEPDNSGLSSDFSGFDDSTSDFSSTDFGMTTDTASEDFSSFAFDTENTGFEQTNESSFGFDEQSTGFDETDGGTTETSFAFDNNTEQVNEFMSTDSSFGFDDNQNSGFEDDNSSFGFDNSSSSGFDDNNSSVGFDNSSFFGFDNDSSDFGFTETSNDSYSGFEKMAETSSSFEEVEEVSEVEESDNLGDSFGFTDNTFSTEEDSVSFGFEDNTQVSSDFMESDDNFNIKEDNTDFSFNNEVIENNQDDASFGLTDNAQDNGFDVQASDDIWGNTSFEVEDTQTNSADNAVNDFNNVSTFNDTTFSDDAVESFSESTSNSFDVSSNSGDFEDVLSSNIGTEVSSSDNYTDDLFSTFDKGEQEFEESMNMFRGNDNNFGGFNGGFTPDPNPQQGFNTGFTPDPSPQQGFGMQPDIPNNVNMGYNQNQMNNFNQMGSSSFTPAVPDEDFDVRDLNNSYENESRQQIIGSVRPQVVHVPVQPQAITGSGVSRYDAILSRQTSQVIVVTGDRRSGVTTTAMEIAAHFGGRKIPTLFVDFDTDYRGALLRYDLDNFMKHPAHVTSGLIQARSGAEVTKYVYRQRGIPFDSLLSIYGTQVTDDILRQTQMQLAYQIQSYGAVVIDCPFSKLHTLEDIFQLAAVYCCIPSDLGGMITTFLRLDELDPTDELQQMATTRGYDSRQAMPEKKLTPKSVAYMYPRMQYIVRQMNSGDNFAENCRYIEDMFDMQNDMYNWTRCKIGGLSTDLSAVLKGMI